MFRALYEKPVALALNVAAWGVEQIARSVEVVSRGVFGRSKSSGKKATRTHRVTKE